MNRPLRRPSEKYAKQKIDRNSSSNLNSVSATHKTGKHFTIIHPCPISRQNWQLLLNTASYESGFDSGSHRSVSDAGYFAPDPSELDPQRKTQDLEARGPRSQCRTPVRTQAHRRTRSKRSHHS